MMQETIQLSAQLPECVTQLAEQHQLGQFRALYRRRLHRLLLWLLPFWITLGVLILTYDGYMLFMDIYYQNVAPPARTLIQFLGAVAHLFCAIAAIVLGILRINPLWGFNKRLYVLDNGLLYLQGKKTETVRWDEIETIHWYKKQAISSIILKNGGQFAHIEEMEKACEVSLVVANAATESLLPGALAQFQKKGEVLFGPLTLTQEGIANCSRLASWEPAPVIPWAEIEGVRFEKGALGLKTDGKWKYWSSGIRDTYKIPNPTLCVALIGHILSHRSSETT